MKPVPSSVSRGAWPGSTPRYPSFPGICASSTCSLMSWRSGVTNSSSRVPAIDSLLDGLQCLGAFLHVFDGSLHIEGLLRQIVVLAFDDFAEALDRVGQLHIFARQ